MLDLIWKVRGFVLACLAGALVALLVSCGAGGNPGPTDEPKPECTPGKIVEIVDSTKKEAEAGNAVAFKLTQCGTRKLKRQPISEEVWLNNANCDVGRFYPKCVNDWGEPGIRLPSDPAEG
jgi:hypothetical protein